MSDNRALRRLAQATAASFLFTLCVPGAIPVKAENQYSVTVDRQGRMRRSDTGAEVRYYGTNYTLPFAHAYRAMDYLDIDHKSAIDRDVYHLSRMGANAFRLHLWDVELTDSVGNLIDNHHLDLLDYLIASLEERGITIVLTAQTNFGNGYPERNIDTGAYTYRYDKCDVHQNPEAIKAQQRYIGQLVRHVNPYTGRSYSADRSIIAMEVNNEPCHQSNPAQVKNYINSMVKAMRKAGWKKPVLYNVSHNMPMVTGYYDADIQGTTYQWYPVGLVSGKEKKGNFLPYVDSYDIPFADTKGFDSKAKLVYEFDPADMLDSYMYPAAARTFASGGFQWATQFAYDPIDMGRFNTEYQTHYLNLAYTPQKALGMKIAAKVMERTPVGSAGKYPADTVFGDFSVSYRQNLAMLNSPREYFHTNTTSVPPVQPDSLREIAGYGSSPVITYERRGAYLLDKVNDRVWRLEILPDILYSADPFSRPSLDRPVAHAINASHPITVKLPQLGQTFAYQGINAANPFGGTAAGGTFSAVPGVYLLAPDQTDIEGVNPEMELGAIRLNEYVAPPTGDVPLHVIHRSRTDHRRSAPLVLTATAFSTPMPDSLVVYPDRWSGQRGGGRVIMEQVAPYTFEAVIPADRLTDGDTFSYRIVAFSDTTATTYPGKISSTPTDWDAPQDTPYYSTRLSSAGDPIVLLSGADGTGDLELATIPDSWGSYSLTTSSGAPFRPDAVKISAGGDKPGVSAILTRYVKDLIAGIPPTERLNTLTIGTGAIEGFNTAKINVVNTDGITWSADIPLTPDGVAQVKLDDMAMGPTLLCPAPYPTFLSREYKPEGYSRPLRWDEIEKIQIVMPSAEPGSFAEFRGITLD